MKIQIDLRTGVIKMIMALVLPISAQTGAGVILMRTPGVHLTYDKITTADVNLYGANARGPVIENKYSAYRFLALADFTGGIDPFSKKIYSKVLNYYDDPNFNKNTRYAYGSDVFHGGESFGAGGVQFLVNGTWVHLPYYNTTDSITIQLLDTSWQKPKVRSNYYGWRMNATTKLSVFLTLSTTWDERLLHCEMKVSGNFKGDIGTGIAKYSGTTIGKDPSKGLLYTLGVQSEIPDSMLVAVSSGPEYFKSFTTAASAIGSDVIVLKPDLDTIVKWTVFSSWAQEPQPTYHDKAWITNIFSSTPTSTALGYDMHLSSKLHGRASKLRILKSHAEIKVPGHNGPLDLSGRSISSAVIKGK